MDGAHCQKNNASQKTLENVKPLIIVSLKIHFFSYLLSRVCLGVVSGEWLGFPFQLK